MPKNISELTCAIIYSEKIKKSDGMIFGTEHCQFVNNEIGGDSYEQIMVLKLEIPSEILWNQIVGSNFLVPFSFPDTF